MTQSKDNDYFNEVRKSRTSVISKETTEKCPRVKGTTTQGGFFSKKLAYRLQLPKSKEEVVRTYEDFEWLHSKFLDLYGNTKLYIPTLPLSVSKSKMTKNKISEQLKDFQRYLYEVTKSRELYDTDCFEYFMNIQHQQNFHKARKSFSQKPKKSKLGLKTRAFKKTGNTDSTTNLTDHVSVPSDDNIPDLDRLNSDSKI